MSDYLFIIYIIVILVSFVLGALSFRAGIKYGFFILKGYYPPSESKSSKHVPEEEEKKESESEKDWDD